MQSLNDMGISIIYWMMRMKSPAVNVLLILHSIKENFHFWSNQGIEGREAVNDRSIQYQATKLHECWVGSFPRLKDRFLFSTARPQNCFASDLNVSQLSNKLCWFQPTGVLILFLWCMRKCFRCVFFNFLIIFGE